MDLADGHYYNVQALLADGHYYNVQALDQSHLERQIRLYDSDRITHLHYHKKDDDCEESCKLVHVEAGQVVEYRPSLINVMGEDIEDWDEWDEWNDYGGEG